MTREKTIDRIKKCLALSKSPNEHEAAAALRQAQKLMAAHGIGEDDVAGAEYVSTSVLTDYEWNDSPRREVSNIISRLKGERPRGGTVPDVVSVVVALVMHATGVGAVYEQRVRGTRGKKFYAVRYFGRRARVEVAVHAHTVVARAVRRAWRRHLEGDPSLRARAGARAGFYIGWCRSVYGKVAALVDEPEEAERIERAKKRHYAQDIPESEANRRRVRGETLEAGEEAGKGFDINRPVRRDQLRIGKDE